MSVVAHPRPDVVPQDVVWSDAWTDEWTDAEEPFAIAHCTTCHVSRNLRGSDPLTGDIIQAFRVEHAARSGHRVTLRLL